MAGRLCFHSLALDQTPAGMAMSIIDGRFLTEPPEAALAAGHQAKVPVMIGANDLPIGIARSKDDLFAWFGENAQAARKAYDPLGRQTLDELEQQVFADKIMVEPVRHFADEATRAGQPLWLCLFAYVSEARGQNMGAWLRNSIRLLLGTVRTDRRSKRRRSSSGRGTIQVTTVRQLLDQKGRETCSSTNSKAGSET